MVYERIIFDKLQVTRSVLNRNLSKFFIKKFYSKPLAKIILITVIFDKLHCLKLPGMSQETPSYSTFLRNNYKCLCAE